LRILFDQGTPAPLAKYLPGHQISTAYEMGWAALKNGELIAAAQSSGFELLITTDQNLRYQQNLSERMISILVLSTTSWPRIRTALPQITDAVDSAQPRGYFEVSIPYLS
jgi:hypothetical protein